MTSPRKDSLSRDSQNAANSVHHDSSRTESIQSFDTDMERREKDPEDLSPADSSLDLQYIPTMTDIDATEKCGDVITQQHGVQEPPYHVFGPRLKGFLVFIVSLVATLSGLSTNIYFPAQLKISEVSTQRHGCDV